MKTIFYSFIILVGIVITSCVQGIPENQQKIVLQSPENATSDLLNQSAEILSRRLKVFGLESFDVKIQNDQKLLQIQIPENVKLPEIKNLLTSKGELAIYETLTRMEFSNLVPNSDQLFKLLIIDTTKDPSGSNLGCVTTDNLNSVNDYIKSNEPKNCKLIWKMKSEKALQCLYALKVNEDGSPLLTGKDVNMIQSSNENSQTLIKIQFKESATDVWANATKSNLNKSIAIVIDDKVLYDPIVKTAMVNGLCEISGDFTPGEVKYFLALVNNDKLPLSFNVK
jgi:preprotein translocase subunit SecD